MSTDYLSIHEAGTYISSARTIVLPEVIGAGTDILAMENACHAHIREVLTYYWIKKKLPWLGT
jgi:hypothetical protein